MPIAANIDMDEFNEMRGNQGVRRPDGKVYDLFGATWDDQSGWELAMFERGGSERGK